MARKDYNDDDVSIPGSEAIFEVSLSELEEIAEKARDLTIQKFEGKIKENNYFLDRVFTVFNSSPSLKEKKNY